MDRQEADSRSDVLLALIVGHSVILGNRAAEIPPNRNLHKHILAAARKPATFVKDRKPKQSAVSSLAFGALDEIE